MLSLSQRKKLGQAGEVTEQEFSRSVCGGSTPKCLADVLLVLVRRIGGLPSPRDATDDGGITCVDTQIGSGTGKLDRRLFVIDATVLKCEYGGMGIRGQ